ncbi:MULTISPECIES: aspartate/glutamate racemase family protein [unclassified Phyllobacterium]|uniref:aspartate/glutamate racemase family protein n=1 Tax=unclassified Phyllobacterium TaxID=2638441 RepID=UPI003012C4AD
MPCVRLINPNTSTETTAMMVAIARDALPSGFVIEGVTAKRGVPMILNEGQLAASASGVIEMALEENDRLDGIIIGAFGDPGIDILRNLVTFPVVGICEASMLDASMKGRRFGIATITPGLVSSFAAKAGSLGVGNLFTGTRLTQGEPEALVANKERLKSALFSAVEKCFLHDGAEAVIVGGGPLGQVAHWLSQRFLAPVIAPIPSAVTLLLKRIGKPQA